MRVVFFGSGEFGIPTLRYLASEHDVALVVTQPDRPGGRGQHLQPTSIRSMAAELGLSAVLATANINAPDVAEQVLSLQPAVGIVAAFGQKIAQPLRDGIRGGCINLHASLLPRHRGAAPVHHAILCGDAETGVTIFRLVERMDAGPVLVQRKTMINPEETTAELHDRLAGIAVDATRAALALYEQDACPRGTPQDDSQATRAPKLSKADGMIDFNRPAAAVADHICAMWSWPGAGCRFIRDSGEGGQAAGEELTLVRARPAEIPAAAVDRPAPPGTIDSRMLVATVGGMLEILEIKPAGGRIMAWRDFVNGRRVHAGDRLVGRGPTVV
jgi:methionyl-tRNA formyltransferase